MVDKAATRRIVEEVMEAVMAGTAGSIALHFAPGAMVSQRSNAAMSDSPWFGRMEGEFRLQGENETRAFFDEMLKRTTYISYEMRGIVCEDDNAASRCDWTRRDEKTGTLITGSTMYWFGFTSDGRIRSIETIGSIHSVIPLRKSESGA
ncbi:nuclear transport factor 2 family protein [Aurantimonas sp. A2-1-M11]|uniref:nuclear transport factor 2 family protein n=1 Tax=Aurantimonas sp. A2-1-M11 TaxID=3113712 RepID=UPI002F91C780